MTEDEKQSGEGIPVGGQQLLDAKLRALNLAAIVAFTDAQGSITYVNDNFCKVSGFSRDELLGKNHRLLKSGRHPREFYAELWRTIASGREWRGELCNRAKNGSLYWVDTSIAPVFGDDGKIVQYIAVRFLITDRKRNELELLRSNEELEQFAYVASHDLQTPLRHISTYIGFLEEDLSGSMTEAVRDSLNVISSSTHRMRALIDDLLELSRVGRRTINIQNADLNQVLADALLQLSDSIEESGATIQAATLPCWPCDRDRMLQLFTNLLQNGIKFRRPQVTPQLVLGVTQGDGEIVLSFADNGIGIKPEYYSRIFEVFQRLHTSKAYEGSGIGLSICKKIAEGHGGRLWVESDSEKGSTFFVSLPVPLSPSSLI